MSGGEKGEREKGSERPKETAVVVVELRGQGRRGKRVQHTDTRTAPFFCLRADSISHPMKSFERKQRSLLASSFSWNPIIAIPLPPSPWKRYLHENIGSQVTG